MEVRSSSSSNKRSWDCSHCGNCTAERNFKSTERRDDSAPEEESTVETGEEEEDERDESKEGEDSNRGEGLDGGWGTNSRTGDFLRAHRVMVNFRELLWYWQEYYLRRGRDRLSIEFSSHIPFFQWNALVGSLIALSVFVISPSCMTDKFSCRSCR